VFGSIEPQSKQVFLATPMDATLRYSSYAPEAD